MTCEDALALLSGHLDGENTQEEEQALLAHLQVCDECRALLSAFEEADAGVLALEAEPPQGLREQILETVRRERPVRSRRRMAPWAVPVVSAAAVVAILLGTGILSQPQLQFTADSASTNTASFARAEMAMDTAATTENADAASEEAAAPETQLVEPEAAMASDAAAAADTDGAVADAAAVTTDAAAEQPQAAADSASAAQEIAQARQARVIVLSAMEPSFAAYTQEFLEDGSVLVTLQDAAAWEQLQTAYPDAPVFEPAAGQAEQYFALVLES